MVVIVLLTPHQQKYTYYMRLLCRYVYSYAPIDQMILKKIHTQNINLIQWKTITSIIMLSLL